jgi:4-oxalomesaconate hydratase
MREAGSEGRKLLIVGAHSGDFVWRAAGAITAATSQSGEARVVALSYGERGESGDLWNEPDQTIENVKRFRHEQAEEAAQVIGASFECWDATGEAGVRYAEAFQRAIPQLVGSL